MEKTYTELQNEFNTKYKEILDFTDNPSSDEYHKRYQALWTLNDKMDRTILRGE